MKVTVTMRVERDAPLPEVFTLRQDGDRVEDVERVAREVARRMMAALDAPRS